MSISPLSCLPGYITIHHCFKYGQANARGAFQVNCQANTFRVLLPTLRLSRKATPDHTGGVAADER